MMRWPWQKPEKRESSGGYTEIIGRLIEAQAAGTTQQASATAAIEAAAGLLSRAFASATVDAPDDIVEALSPRCRALIGRDLIRVGESLNALRMMGGRLRLVPASTWYWEGDADPGDGGFAPRLPTGLAVRRLGGCRGRASSWSSGALRPPAPFTGSHPRTWAAEAARLNANAERSLADEAGGPVAALLTVPGRPGRGLR